MWKQKTLKKSLDSFNKQVIVESFNRTVLEEIAKNIDPESPREQDNCHFVLEEDISNSCTKSFKFLLYVLFL